MASKQTDKRIDEICDERGFGNGYFVYLKPGFQYDGAHCFAEDTKADVRRTMQRVKPCTCSDCADRAELARLRSSFPVAE
jgi:hypothetical protein